MIVGIGNVRGKGLKIGRTTEERKWHCRYGEEGIYRKEGVSLKIWRESI